MALPQGYGESQSHEGLTYAPTFSKKVTHLLDNTINMFVILFLNINSCIKYNLIMVLLLSYQLSLFVYEILATRLHPRLYSLLLNNTFLEN